MRKENISAHFNLQEFPDKFKSTKDLKVASELSGIFQLWLEEQKLPANLLNTLQEIYVPFVNILLNKTDLASNITPVIGICGSQGSGKSTFTYLLSRILETGYGLRVASFSIDDFYLTLKEREDNSRNIHPLLKTRGVPGTHDVNLGTKTIKDLINADKSTETPIPCFDKSVDDRCKSDQWTIYKGKPDVVLFEGWCVGAIPQEVTQLINPINDFEEKYDRDGSYRRYINNQLAGKYREWFSRITFQVFLKVPSFSKVYEWRWLQEVKLKEKTMANEQKQPGLKIMNEQEVKFFISHYERITRHILYEMPSRADVVFDIGNNHQFEKVLVNFH